MIVPYASIPPVIPDWVWTAGFVCTLGVIASAFAAAATTRDAKKAGGAAPEAPRRALLVFLFAGCALTTITLVGGMNARGQARGVASDETVASISAAYGLADLETTYDTRHRDGQSKILACQPDKGAQSRVAWAGNGHGTVSIAPVENGCLVTVITDDGTVLEPVHQ